MREEEGLKQILEQARQDLNNLQYQYDLDHPAVLHQSMVLDELINQYTRSNITQVKKRSGAAGSRLASEELWPTRSQLYRTANSAS
ncbi:Spo0E like sporulation regulatory protein [compost metagenome]